MIINLQRNLTKIILLKKDLCKITPHLLCMEFVLFSPFKPKHKVFAKILYLSCSRKWTPMPESLFFFENKHFLKIIVPLVAVLFFLSLAQLKEILSLRNLYKYQSFKGERKINHTWFISKQCLLYEIYRNERTILL